MYFMFILPINMSTMQVKNSSNAVERFAGRINPQTRITGATIGTKADLKSLIFSCFFESIRATNIINASLAKSEVWNVVLIPGKDNQRLAWFRFVPKTKVIKRSG